MDMRNTMSGMDQLYNAMVQQAMDAPPIQVDEMQQGNQAQRDEMREIAGLGQDMRNLDGLTQMMMALDASGAKEKDKPDVFIPPPRGF